MTPDKTPSDSEILDAAEEFRSQYMHGGTTFDDFDVLGFARAVLAKWGSPAGAGEPDYATFALWYADHIGDENKPVREAAWETYQAFATPQPTQAQAGAVPLTSQRIDEICAELRNTVGCSNTTLARAIERAHDIKEGGQHADRSRD